MRNTITDSDLSIDSYIERINRAFHFARRTQDTPEAIFAGSLELRVGQAPNVLVRSSDSESGFTLRNGVYQTLEFLALNRDRVVSHSAIF